LASGLFLSYLPAALFRTRRYTAPGLSERSGGCFAALASIGYGAANRRLAGRVAIAVVTCDIAEEQMGRVDDPRMVIDECVGYWTTLLFLPRTLFTIAAGFVLSEFWTSTNFPGSTVGRLSGGWGVVMDDILAGVVANGLLHGLRLLYPH